MHLGSHMIGGVIKVASPQRDRLTISLFGRLLGRGLLITLFLLFAWSNFAHWRATGRPSGFGITSLEAWVAVLFLFRRSAQQLSRSALAWVAAPIGTFAMLLARPEGHGLPQLPCEVLQFAGVAFALVSLGTLGRSFGLVAANRGVQTRGPYALVRHPAYAGYLLTYLGYLAENPAPRNIALLVVGTAFQLVRIREEERVLSGAEDYREYRGAVRFRLVPYVY